MDKYIGRMLDNRYEILEVIGSGGMAVVYKARCHRLNRLVAIKILKDDNLEDEDFRRRFHAESQTVATLSHPNIVSVFDVSSSIMADYIVMELIEGISLKQYMEKKGTLNWKETLHFAIQIAKALEHAHSRGIVHRDIKPHNVMVLKNGSVKVTDFGIARMMSKGNTLTKEALGSVHYISPEQAKGGRVDSRSDLYSLGVVMYEMMTGRPPYDGDSPVAVAIKHINGGALMPSVLNPNIPGGLEQIIMKAMTHEIEDRYVSATKMLADMDEFRKDPTMLFDYNAPPLDIVTRIPRSPLADQPPQTTADRVEEAASTHKRPATPPERRTSTSSQRRRQAEEKSNRTATIAIIACSLAAVMAIIIFLVILLGSSGGSRENLIEVPNLMGLEYEKLPEYEDFKIISDTVYDEDDPAGVILQQQPEAGDMVVSGTKIVVTVSMGPAPKAITMSELVNLPRIQAEKILKDLDLNLNIRLEEEHSDTVSQGNVTRTEPKQGAELTAGQTVTLWISNGEEIKTGAMPNVVGTEVETARETLNNQGLKLKIAVEEVYDSVIPAGQIVKTEPEKGEPLETGKDVVLYVSKGPQLTKMPNVVGMNIDTAITVLKAAGFQTPDIKLVESDEVENTVVSQSVEKNTDVDINAQIILEVSKKAESTQPTQPDAPTQRTMDVEILLPEDYITSANYTVEIKLNGKTVQTATVAVGSSSVVVSLTGSGTQYFEVWIGGQLYRTQEVDFTTNG